MTLWEVLHKLVDVTAKVLHFAIDEVEKLPDMFATEEEDDEEE